MLVKQFGCHEDKNGKLHLRGQSGIHYLRLHVYFFVYMALGNVESL